MLKGMGSRVLAGLPGPVEIFPTALLPREQPFLLKDAHHAADRHRGRGRWQIILNLQDGGVSSRVDAIHDLTFPAAELRGIHGFTA